MIVPMGSDDGENFDLYLGDTAEEDPGKRLTRGQSSDFSAVLSPDRQSVIFVRDFEPNNPRGKRVLRVMAADGTGARDLFRKPPSFCSRVYRPAWNPVDQTMLALPCLDENRAPGLHLVRTNGERIGKIEIPDQCRSPLARRRAELLTEWQATCLLGWPRPQWRSAVCVRCAPRGPANPLDQRPLPRPRL